MPLTIGTRLGSYEIVSPLGQGGMGEVYRARDSVLGRDVALKILPAAFTHDPDRVARFRREAQLLASLNHPHIAAIYGLEESGDIPALVLELVEGPTLADVITGTASGVGPGAVGLRRRDSVSGPEPSAQSLEPAGGLPIAEALPIARQIAEALEAAHATGIVHRDLKPANVKLRPDGTVKVLDFGLAKALAPDPASAAAGDASQSPTITSPAMTRAGVILGTAAYMSPEQARGQAVDRGADIWAFGCVLFEMLTGTRAFPGDDPTETIAAIIRADPDWSRLPPDTPESIRRTLRRCLEKDRTRRLADIRDARLEIEEAGQAPPVLPVVAERTPRLRERLIWIAALAALAIVAVAALLRTTDGGPSVPSSPEMRVEITTPPTTDPVSLALSPDGMKLVFVASSDGRPLLWLRSLVSGEARPLQGTDGASFPFWSPDSRSVAFFTDERIKRLDLDGGSPRNLALAPVGAGGTWGADGTILFPQVPDSPLFRVSADGGLALPLPVVETERGPGHRFPQLLPDGRRFLYYVAESRAVYAGAIDRPERQRLFDADAAAVFVPPGEVLFIRAGTLFAQRFDPVGLELLGEPSVLAEGIAIDEFGVAPVSASATGSVVYRAGAVTRERRLAWFDRSGAELRTIGGPDTATARNPSLSPDGRQVALSRGVAGNTDIWTLDLARDVLTRFTTETGPDISPVWSPDGDRIAYSAAARAPQGSQGVFNVFHKHRGTGETTLLVDTDLPAIAMDWSPDGRFFLFRTRPLNETTGWDIWAAPLEGDGQPFPVVRTSFEDRTAQFSPDGRWVAYETNQSGRFQIHVQPFPGPGASTPVSTGGGVQPRWRPDGREIFYVAPDGRLMAVPVVPPASGQDIELGSPVALFLTRIDSSVQGGTLHDYSVSNDGQQFLMNTFVEARASPLTLILNRRGQGRPER